MKVIATIFLILGLILELNAAEPIVLDKAAIKNIKLELGEAKPRFFEETVFAIGRLEDIPSRQGTLSSRIAGKIVELKVKIGDQVKKDQVLAVLESRQMGNPPPRVPLKSPTSGLVVMSKLSLGNPVDPSDRLMEICDRSILWARASIPEGEMKGITPGTKARVTIPAIEAPPIEVSLKRFGINAFSSRSTVDGVFEVSNPEGRLSPGMRVEFSIVRSSRPSVLSIPRTAIQGDPLGRHVFVQNFTLSNAFEKTPVVLGAWNDAWVEVISGLFPGDQVVTQGSYALSYSTPGTGMSLKEALDAAHGHEHNEDGTEMTAEQKRQRAKGDDKFIESGRKQAPRWILFYAGCTTVLSLWLLQGRLRERRKG